MYSSRSSLIEAINRFTSSVEGVCSSGFFGAGSVTANTAAGRYIFTAEIIRPYMFRIVFGDLPSVTRSETKRCTVMVSNLITL